MGHGAPSGFKEMTLAEWIDTLPPGHGARREFDSITGRLEVAQGFHKVAVAEREYERAKNDRLETQHRTMLQKIENLLTFKQYVHARLDMAGVPVDPPGSHSGDEAGDCRIAGRLDCVLEQVAKWTAHEATLPPASTAEVIPMFPEAS